MQPNGSVSVIKVIKAPKKLEIDRQTFLNRIKKNREQANVTSVRDRIHQIGPLKVHC